jgi:hypothetical protein
MAASHPERIGKYAVKRALGRGAMGGGPQLVGAG